MKKEKSRTETAMEPKVEAKEPEQPEQQKQPEQWRQPEQRKPPELRKQPEQQRQPEQPELRKTARAKAKVEAMKHKPQEPEREASKEPVTAGSSATAEENSWQDVDESAMNLGQRCVYRNRKRAMELYRRGCSPQEIFRITGMGPGMVSRMWKKCCTKDPETGNVKGYQALVPKSKVKSFIR